MDAQQAQERMDMLLSIIKQEAENEAEEVIEEGQVKANERKNKVFANLREGLISEFNKMDDDEQVRVRTLKSRRINNARIEVQEKRNDLLNGLRDSAKEKIMEMMKDQKKYKEFLVKLIVQGLARLLERRVKIRCRAQDTKLVEEAIPLAKKEFEKFLKDNADKEVDMEISLINKPLEKGESELGGVILYCHNNKIVFTNTIDARLDLGFQESIPDIRSGLFPNTQVLEQE